MEVCLGSGNQAVLVDLTVHHVQSNEYNPSRTSISIDDIVQNQYDAPHGSSNDYKDTL